MIGFGGTRGLVRAWVGSDIRNMYRDLPFATACVFEPRTDIMVKEVLSAVWVVTFGGSQKGKRGKREIEETYYAFQLGTPLQPWPQLKVLGLVWYGKELPRMESLPSVTAIPVKRGYRSAWTSLWFKSYC